MKPQSLPVALLAAVLLAAAGCGRDKEEPVAPPENLADAFPFLRHAPGDSEAFLAVRHPAGIWRQFASAWEPVLSDPGVRQSREETAAGALADAFLGGPRTPALLEALHEAAEYEMFVLCGRGTGAQLASLQQAKRLFEAARLRNLFTPWPAADIPEEEVPLEGIAEDPARAAFTEVVVPLPPAMQETLEEFVRDAALPPLLLGAKLPADAALPGLLEEWVAALPEQIPRDRVVHKDQDTFTRVRLPVTMLVPSAVASRARDILAANIGDVYAATYIVRDLLSKVTTLGFGRLHGWFVISLGNESGFPELASAPDDSLAAAPALRGLQALPAGNAEAVIYADRLVVGLAAAPPPVAEYLDAALESALEFAPAETIGPIRAQAAPLRAQAADLFRPRTFPFAGVLQRSGGVWRADMSGGSLAPRLAASNADPLLAPDAAVDILWTEQWEDGYARRLAEFAGGMAAFAGSWVEALGPVFLEGTNHSVAGGILRGVAGPAELLKGNASELVGNALGPQVALAVSFDGTMPSAPLLPAAAGKAILPRIGAMAALRDRKSLARAWADLTAAGPQTSWPPPIGTTEADGMVSYAYPLPSGGPDLGAVVTVTGSRWLLGNSRAYNETVGALPGGRDAAVQTIEFSTAPLATFAAAWSDALAAEPTLAPLLAGLLPDNPQTLSALADLLKTPRRLRYEAKWEDGTLHRVIELGPAP